MENREIEVQSWRSTQVLSHSCAEEKGESKLDGSSKKKKN